MLNKPSSQPEIIDLEMSDLEYLQFLAQGRDPLKERFYEQELLGFGISLQEARQVAPLFDKLERTLEEKILVGRAIKQIWDQIAGPSDVIEVMSAFYGSTAVG